MKKNIENITIEGAKILFRNFAGQPTKFNTKGGERSFCTLIDNDIAETLILDGWNIKWLKARDEDEEDQAYLKVKVAYGNISPNVYLISGRNKTLLNEETICSLDYAEISNVDLIIRPYSWEVNGKEGVTAYVKSMYVTVQEDEFASKYNFENEEIPF